MNEYETSRGPNDPVGSAASAIKDALGREVARRFDAHRVAADFARAIASHATGESALAGREAPREMNTTGPFARVPVPLQWLGLAAAIIAAAAGIRSVYRDWASPASVPLQSGAVPRPGEASSPSGPAAVAPQAAASPDASAGQITSAIPDRAGGRGRTPARRSVTRLETDEDQSVPASPPPHAPPAPAPERIARGSAEGRRAPSATGRIVAIAPGGRGREEAGGPVTGRVEEPSPTAITGAVIIGESLPSGAGEVRVAVQQLLSQGLTAEIRAAPALHATLISLRATARAPRSADAAPAGDPSVLGRPGRGGRPFRTGEGPAGRGQMTPPRRSDGRHGPPPVEAWSPGPTESPGTARTSGPLSASGARTESGPRTESGALSGSGAPNDVYYARAFVGSAFRNLADDEQGYLGTGTDAIALRSHETWGAPGQVEALRRTFDLQSLVAIDGARVPLPSGSRVAEATLDVAAGRRVYEIGIKAGPAEGGAAAHDIVVRLARKLLPGERPSREREIVVPVTAGNGTMAVLCISDSVFSGEPGWDASNKQDMLFLAISPRFADLAPGPDLGVQPRPDRWYDPAVVADRVEPLYPDEARTLGIEGEVVLGATVRRDGGVEGVHVVSIPKKEGAELLIEPASSALRRWRFLPARDQGEPIDSLVTTSIEFRLARDDR